MKMTRGIIILCLVFLFVGCDSYVSEDLLTDETNDNSLVSDLDVESTEMKDSLIIEEVESEMKEQEAITVEVEEEQQEASSVDVVEEQQEVIEEEVLMNTIKISVNGSVLTATLVDNSSVDAFMELLSKGPLTIEMSDYGNMEKVGSIGEQLPTNDTRITTEPGDIILYQGSALVIYYDANTWSFTRLGKIDGLTQEELKDILGDGSVTVTIEEDIR